MATAEIEQGLVERVQELTERLEGIADFEARALADELAAAIVRLYGEGLERIFAALAEPTATAAQIREQLTADGVVASLMLIHGLYPVDLETRVREALESVRPYLDSHGGNVELLGIEDGIARLRLGGSCDGCGASASTLELAIEKALEESAPDLLGLDVEGAVAPPPARPVRPPLGDPSWVELAGAGELPRGGVATAGDGLLLANVAGTLLAYLDACAECANALHTGVLEGGTLTCGTCGREYDLPKAGRARDGSPLQLAPVPLLRSNGTVKVALSG